MYDQFKIIEIDKTMDIIGNDKDFLKEMLVEFFKDLPSRLNKLENAITSNNFDEIKWYAHKIRGSLAVYYMIKSSEISAYIEKNFNNSDAELKKHFDLLKIEVIEIHKYFEDFLQESFELNLNI